MLMFSDFLCRKKAHTKLNYFFSQSKIGHTLLMSFNIQTIS